MTLMAHTDYQMRLLLFV